MKYRYSIIFTILFLISIQTVLSGICAPDLSVCCSNLDDDIRNMYAAIIDLISSSSISVYFGADNNYMINLNE